MQVGHARITFCNYFLSSDSFPLPFWPSFGLAKKPKLQATGTIWSPTDLTMPPKRVSPTNGRAMFKPHFGHSPRSPQQTSKQWQDEALRSLKPCFCDNFAPALASRHFWLSNLVKFRENVRNLNAKSLGSCHGLNILVKRQWKRATRSLLFPCIETWWVQLLWLRLKIRWASFHTVVSKIKYVNSWWWSRQYQQHAPTKPETRLRMQIWANLFWISNSWNLQLKKCWTFTKGPMPKLFRKMCDHWIVTDEGKLLLQVLWNWRLSSLEISLRFIRELEFPNTFILPHLLTLKTKDIQKPKPKAIPSPHKMMKCTYVTYVHTVLSNGHWPFG